MRLKNRRIGTDWRKRKLRRSTPAADIFPWGEKMGKREMAADWEKEKEYVVKRMDRFDERFDKIDAIISKQGQQIEGLKIEVLKIFMGMNSFKSEFRWKTGAWAFLGTAIALTGYVVYQLVKSQLI
jgi:hypothetical protein